MTPFTGTALREMLDLTLHPSVSVLMPRHPTDMKMSQDSISILTRADGPRPGAEDLLNLAVVYTLQRSGSVHGVAREHVPGGPSGVAALLRY